MLTPSQSRLESAIETAANIGSGFLLSLGLWIFVVAPLFSVHKPFVENFAITCLFTVTSVARSYLWRRFFNKRLHSRLDKLLADRTTEG